MKRPAMASRRPLERGEFSWVGALLLVGMVASGYLSYVWVPVYMDHLEAKRIARDFMNQAVHEHSDDVLLDRLCQKLRNIKAKTVAAEGEGTVEVSVVDLSPEDVTWERDDAAVPPMLHVAFEYTRPVYYPFLEKVRESTFSFEHTQDIAVPQWNK